MDKKKCLAYLNKILNAKCSIDLKNYDCQTIDETASLEQGKISDETVLNNLFNQTSRNDEDIKVIIMPKVVISKSIVDKTNGEKVINSEVFKTKIPLIYIPAKLNKEGYLCPNGNKMPWIPLDVFKPFGDNISIAEWNETNNKLDEIESNWYEEKNKNWKDYWDIVKNIYITLTKTEWDKKEVKELNAECTYYNISDSVSISIDDTIDSTFKIRDLQKYLVESIYNNKLKAALLNNLLSKPNYQIESPYSDQDIDVMKSHMGVMSSIYPLSPSQREALHHLKKLSYGDVLAVSGPPGTGKTTLLQSVVADLIVEHALNKQKAPIIVATSTNNNAVINIIDSFKNVTKKHDDEYITEERKLLEKRWIKEPSLAAFFPSKSKENDKDIKTYFKTTKKGEIDYKKIEFIDDKTSESKFEENKKFFKLCCTQCFYVKNNKFYWQNVKEKIHAEINTRKEYLHSILLTINDIMNIKQKKEESPESFKWCNSLDAAYGDLINKLNGLSMFGFDYKVCLKKITHNLHKKEKLEKGIKQEGTDNIKEVGISEMSGLLDITLRYQMFWLAVHYYEARWLSKENFIQTKENFKTVEKIQEKRFHRMAMITPCMVMTCFNLPDVFKTHNGPYMQCIDLLIVDEAGQVSPELAIPSFALAKKAIVVGDEHQIPPVWSVNDKIDYELYKWAFDKEAVQNIEEFYHLPFNCSSSSLMRLANNACKFKKCNNDGGLFLSEHRRCYDEIISFCNDLVYRSQLKPLRPEIFEEDRKLGQACPAMGSFCVDHAVSEEMNGSRCCKQEANAIAKWIGNNYDSIRKAYSKGQHFEIKNAVCIITPFKIQADIIKESLKNAANKHDDIAKIECGTVHKFQGKENKIVIFSTVYGKNENWTFIKNNENLINVAVSRAKDYFFTFGTRSFNGYVSGKPNNAAALLLDYTKQEIPKWLNNKENIKNC